ncbi:MAG: hypothetical protein JWM23_542 [Microbacteriaceae bacterium]|nr:hypothetical protein [Microbacteriaceae bacterium]
MTELRDYSAFAEGPLVFPINGKRYELGELGIEAGITLAGIVTGKNKVAARMEGVELWKLLLGPLWDEMIEDGVPLAAATRAGLTALADHQYGRDVAEITWETGADPKVLEPYLEARAAKTANRATRRSNSTGGAKKTPSRASTRATSSRPK